MATIKESALAYESPQTLNISELDYVSIDIEVKEETHTNKDNEEYSVSITEIDGKKYRIPGSVLDCIKSLLQRVPDMKHVQVLRSGAGMNTRYQVIPYTLKQ